MKTVCLGAEVVKGFDVSEWQGPNFNFKALYAQGHRFGIIRCTNGLNTDKYAVRNIHAAQDAGLIVGMYTYFRPSENPDAQAELALKVVGDVKGSLGIIPDCEQTDGVLAPLDRARIQKFIEDVGSKGIYGGPYYLEALGFPPDVAQKYWLWVAEYGPHCPQIPHPWSIATIWQWSNSNNKLDVNLFNGNLSQLQKLII